MKTRNKIISCKVIEIDDATKRPPIIMQLRMNAFFYVLVKQKRVLFRADSRGFMTSYFTMMYHHDPDSSL